MPEIQEGTIKLSFPSNHKVIKYDDSDWYKTQINRQWKGMDVLVCDAANNHWWIEIKDMEGYESSNSSRLSNNMDTTEVEQARAYIETQGWQN